VTQIYFQKGFGLAAEVGPDLVRSYQSPVVERPSVALGTRLGLLFTLSFLLGLTTPIFTLPEMPFLKDVEAREVSWRDIILFVGGAFLIGKSVLEMHEKMEHADGRRIVFPFHDELDRTTLKNALRDTPIAIEDFLANVK